MLECVARNRKRVNQGRRADGEGGAKLNDAEALQTTARGAAMNAKGRRRRRIQTKGAQTTLWIAMRLRVVLLPASLAHAASRRRVGIHDQVGNGAAVAEQACLPISAGRRRAGRVRRREVTLCWSLFKCADQSGVLWWQWCGEARAA